MHIIIKPQTDILPRSSLQAERAAVDSPSLRGAACFSPLASLYLTVGGARERARGGESRESVGGS